MARPDPGAIVPMEIFIEQHVIAPMWIVLKDLRTAEHWTFPFSVPEKNVRQAT
jgi:hypothetical protein